MTIDHEPVYQKYILFRSNVCSYIHVTLTSLMSTKLMETLVLIVWYCKTVLKVRRSKEASLRGSKGAFVSWCSSRERFQEGMPFRPLGLPLWKLSKRRVRFSSLLGKFPSLSAMAAINGSQQWTL